MKFVIAKPVAKMSVGDLFYSAPRKSEIDKAYDELIQICLRRADREFPRHPDYPKRNGMIPQVEKELRMIQNSELVPWWRLRRRTLEVPPPLRPDT